MSNNEKINFNSNLIIYGDFNYKKNIVNLTNNYKYKIPYKYIKEFINIYKYYNNLISDDKKKILFSLLDFYKYLLNLNIKTKTKYINYIKNYLGYNELIRSLNEFNILDNTKTLIYFKLEIEILKELKKIINTK